MEQKKSLFDTALQELASIPYLRKILQFLWVFSTSNLGIILLMQGIAIFKGTIPFKFEWMKSVLLWAGINPFFAYVLYRWKKKEMSKPNIK